MLYPYFRLNRSLLKTMVKAELRVDHSYMKEKNVKYLVHIYSWIY